MDLHPPPHRQANSERCCASQLANAATLIMYMQHTSLIRSFLGWFLAVFAWSVAAKIEALAEGPSNRYWYNQAGDRWVYGTLVDLDERYISIRDTAGELQHLTMASRSPPDVAAVTSLRLLADVADEFRQSPFPGTLVELERMRDVLQHRGAAVEWATSAVGEMPSEYFDSLETWRRIALGLAGTDSRFRWVVLRGVEYPIDSVESAVDASGLTELAIRDHDGRRQIIPPGVYARVGFLPKLWDQPTYQATDARSQATSWTWRRGPSPWVGLQYPSGELVFADVRTVSGPRSLWTLAALVPAYEQVAKAEQAWNESERLIASYHRRRHEIVGDERCLQEDYLAAIFEYTEALRYDPNRGVNYLRRGFAFVGANRLAAAADDFQSAIQKSEDDQVTNTAARELQARLNSLTAIRSTNDDQALKYHQTAMRLAAEIKATNFASELHRLPEPVRLWFLAYYETDVRTIALRDMKRRADRWLKAGLKSLASGQFENCVVQSERAVALSMGQTTVVSPAKEISSRAVAMRASKEISPAVAAKYYGDAINLATEAAQPNPQYWSSPEIDSDVRDAFAAWRMSDARPWPEVLREGAHDDFIRRADKLEKAIASQIDSMNRRYTPLVQRASEWTARSSFEAALKVLAELDSSLADAAIQCDVVTTVLGHADGFVQGSNVPPKSAAPRQTLAELKRNRDSEYNAVQRSLARVEGVFSGWLYDQEEFASGLSYALNSEVRKAKILQRLTKMTP